MLKLRVVFVMAAFGLISLPTPALARGDQNGLVQLMFDQFVQNIVLATSPTGVGVAAHTPVFESSAEVDAITALVAQVSQQIGAQISNTPLGSSSGGFTYTLDPSSGTFKRTAQSFGPAFAERALTSGKGKFSFGMNYQHSKYSKLDGKDLENGEVLFFLPHEHLSPASFIEGDVIEAAVHVNLTSDTTAFFVNYGVTDRLDIGLAVPLQHVSMDLRYHATIRDFATHAVSPLTHRFDNGLKEEDFISSGSASGLGDMILRTKYGLNAKGANAMAIGFDLRLPTGDEENMLGTGATQAYVFFITSSQRGNWSPHLNAGFTAVGGSDNASSQINYVGGTEYAASPKWTLVADLLGKTYTGSKRLVDDPQEHTFRQGDNAPLESVTLDAFATEKGTLTSFLGTVGFKFNPTGNMLISAHVLFSLNSAGLRRGVTPVIGFDYSR